MQIERCHQAVLEMLLQRVGQVADDADFKTNVRTLFNNDKANDSGLGVGTDRTQFDLGWNKFGMIGATATAAAQAVFARAQR